MSLVAQVAIVLGAVISLTVIVFAYFTVTPVFLEIYDDGVTGGKCVGNTNCLTVHERQYEIWFVIFFLGVGGFWAALYARSVRRDSIETSYGGGPL